MPCLALRLLVDVVPWFAGLPFSCREAAIYLHYCLARGSAFSHLPPDLSLSAYCSAGPSCLPCTSLALSQPSQTVHFPPPTAGTAGLWQAGRRGRQGVWGRVSRRRGV